MLIRFLPGFATRHQVHPVTAAVAVATSIFKRFDSLVISTSVIVVAAAAAGIIFLFFLLNDGHCNTNQSFYYTVCICIAASS